MRIYGIVFGSLVVMVVLLVAGWFLRESIILGIASWQLSQDLSTLKQTAFSNADSDGCTQKDIPVEGASVLGYQLRFISDTDYVIEAVCNQVIRPTVQISQGHLFGGVVRHYGSGILINTVDRTQISNGWVFLRFGKKEIAVGIFNGSVDTRWDMSHLAIGGDTPARANCSDWGFTCCQKGISAGMESQVFAMDCPDTCYQQCDQLPTVLFFNSDPMLDEQSRTLLINAAKTTVTFGFNVADYDDGVAKTQIDFGDETIADNLGAQEDQVSHDYSCYQPTCIYTVKLTGWDKQGNQTPATSVSQVKVILQP